MNVYSTGLHYIDMIYNADLLPLAYIALTDDDMILFHANNNSMLFNLSTALFLQCKDEMEQMRAYLEEHNITHY